MRKNCNSALERWGGVSDTIDRWLQDRQELLVLYCNLTAPQDHETPEDQQEHEDNLRKFCQILVDYVSAGHFEIYERLAKEGRELGDEEGLRKAKKHYQAIGGTTEAILDFNDKYQETDDLTTLLTDLSELGEMLETRFEAEDGMIEILHVAHKGQVA